MPSLTLVRAWARRNHESMAGVRRALILMRGRARYAPPVHHLHRGWWERVVGDG